MKKIIVILGIIVLLVPSAFAVSDENSNTTRVLIRTDNPNLETELKQMLDIRHEFGRLGFTAEVDVDTVQVLRSMEGVTVEQVSMSRIDAKPEKPPRPPKGPKNGAREYYPDDPTPYGIEMMYNDDSIETTSGGAGVDVAVLDTGVNKDHLDLKSRVEQCKDFTGRRVKNGCKDTNGHGTHVAGTILADGGADGKGIWGMAPEANLFAYKVCGAVYCQNDDVASAIYYAADNGAEIISMSLSGDYESSLIRDAVTYAVGKGLLVIAAAGNDGPGYGSIDYPAANPNVAAIGAINNNMQVPYWSSRGINDGDYVIEVREVEFGAPGVNVESTWKNGYDYKDGTSMATPHVSGLAAKLWQGNGASTRTYLQNRAVDIWDPGDDTATGFGLPTV